MSPAELGTQRTPLDETQFDCFACCGSSGLLIFSDLQIDSIGSGAHRRSESDRLPTTLGGLVSRVPPAQNFSACENERRCGQAGGGGGGGGGGGRLARDMDGVHARPRLAHLVRLLPLGRVGAHPAAVCLGYPRLRTAHALRGGMAAEPLQPAQLRAVGATDSASEPPTRAGRCGCGRPLRSCARVDGRCPLSKPRPTRSARMAPRRLHPRQSMPQATPSSGQPRPIRRLCCAGRPHPTQALPAGSCGSH